MMQKRIYICIKVCVKILSLYKRPQIKKSKKNHPKEWQIKNITYI